MTLGSKVLWKTRLPDVKLAVLPPSTTRPNPIVIGELVFVSVFASGAVCALNKRTGKLLWRHALPHFGGPSVYFAEDMLFVMTPKSIHALDPRTGDSLWEFVPYDRPGEWIYSQPVVHLGLLYYGDRRGDSMALEISRSECLFSDRCARSMSRDSRSRHPIS